MELRDETAQALWAAMHDDDDLASEYVDFALLHALTHLRNDRFHMHLTEEGRTRFLINLEALRDTMEEIVDDNAARWMSYCEPPF